VTALTDQPEEWRPIVNYEGLYEVSSNGRVRSLGHFDTAVNRKKRWCPPQILSQHVHKQWGYHQVHLNRHGSRRTVRVHVLVCTAFRGPRPAGQDARHLNDDKSDNSASNLAWGTKTQNMFDAVRNGTHPMSKKTHCKRRHEFTPENTRIYDGRRWCRVRLADARRRAARRQKQAV